MPLIVLPVPPITPSVASKATIVLSTTRLPLLSVTLIINEMVVLVKLASGVMVSAEI